MEMTERITARIAEDDSFAKHVSDSLERFERNDWGSVEEYVREAGANRSPGGWERRNKRNVESAKTRVWPRSNFGDQLRLTATYGTGDNSILVISEAPFEKKGKHLVGSMVVLYPFEF